MLDGRASDDTGDWWLLKNKVVMILTIETLQQEQIKSMDIQIGIKL